MSEARARWSLAQDDLKSYQQAAEFLNFNNIDMVCLQHEYGIFGGPVAVGSPLIIVDVSAGDGTGEKVDKAALAGNVAATPPADAARPRTGHEKPVST